MRLQCGPLTGGRVDERSIDEHAATSAQEGTLKALALSLALTLAVGSLLGCRGAPQVDLILSVVNGSASIVAVTVTGTARHTLSVHPCAGSAVGLPEGDYEVTIDGPPQQQQFNLRVPLHSGATPGQVILVRADGTVDLHSDADPNKKAC